MSFSHTAGPEWPASPHGPLAPTLDFLEVVNEPQEVALTLHVLLFLSSKRGAQTLVALCPARP